MYILNKFEQLGRGPNEPTIVSYKVLPTDFVLPSHLVVEDEGQGTEAAKREMKTWGVPHQTVPHGDEQYNYSIVEVDSIETMIICDHIDIGQFDGYLQIRDETIELPQAWR